MYFHIIINLSVCVCSSQQLLIKFNARLTQLLPRDRTIQSHHCQSPPRDSTSQSHHRSAPPHIAVGQASSCLTAHQHKIGYLVPYAVGQTTSMNGNRLVTVVWRTCYCNYCCGGCKTAKPRDSQQSDRWMHARHVPPRLNTTPCMPQRSSAVYR